MTRKELTVKGRSVVIHDQGPNDFIQNMVTVTVDCKDYRFTDEQVHDGTVEAFLAAGIAGLIAGGKS